MSSRYSRLLSTELAYEMFTVFLKKAVGNSSDQPSREVKTASVCDLRDLQAPNRIFAFSARSRNGSATCPNHYDNSSGESRLLKNLLCVSPFIKFAPPNPA